MSDLDAMQEQIGAWGDRTFPNATIGSIISHLREEVDELAIACDRALDRARIGPEAADVVMLVIQLAHRNGFSLAEEVERKFAVNQQRRWTVTAPGGHTKHEEGQDGN